MKSIDTLDHSIFQNVNDKYDNTGNYIMSLRSFKKTKSKAWLTRMILANKIGYILHDLNGNNERKSLSTDTARQAFLTSFLGYIEQLSIIYDDDNWDIGIYKADLPNMDCEYNGKYFLYVIIRFESFVIRNSQGINRTLKDVFVTFELKVTYVDDGKMILRPSVPHGFRTSIAQDEWNSGYVHSHLDFFSANDNHFTKLQRVIHTSKFCIGNDDIEDLIALLGNSYDPYLFASFLSTIITLVTWESLEGKPHRHMRNITSRVITNNGIRVPSMNVNVITSSYEYIFNTEHNFFRNIEFRLNENHYGIHFNKLAIKGIKDTLIDAEDYNFLVKKVAGKYICYRSETNLVNDNGFNNHYTIFNGNKIFLKMYNKTNSLTTQTEDINDYSVYPNFLNKLKDDLEKQFYNFSTSTSIIEKRNQSIHS